MCVTKTNILFGQLNCSVKLADVSTRCSSHPQGKSFTEQLSCPKRIFVLFMQIATENDVTSINVRSANNRGWSVIKVLHKKKQLSWSLCTLELCLVLSI